MPYLKYGCRFYWFLTLFGLSYGSLNFATDLPSTIRYNVKESVVLTAIGATVDQSITIQLEITSENGDLVQYFSSDTSHQFSKNFHTFHIPFKITPTLEECQTNEIDKEEDFMCSAYLTITVTEFPFPLWTKSIKIDVVKTPRTIHIETDRPIYFPGDWVFVRFIPLNEDLILLKEKALLTIESPAIGEERMISWQKDVTFSEQPFVRKFLIPKDGLLGEWKISAKFTRNTATDRVFQSGFEIAYFTFPTFKVSLDYMTKNFILPHDEIVRFHVTARTLHDKPIKGSVHMRFGRASSLGDEYSVYTHAVKNKQLGNGETYLDIAVSDLIGARSFSSVDGMKLIVITSVTEFGSGGTVTIRDESVLFTSKAYAIKFIKGRQFFHPGVPAIINVKVSYVNGSVAAGVKTTFEMTYFNNDGAKIGSHFDHKTTCQFGTAMIRTSTPTRSHSIKVGVYASYTSTENNQVYVTEKINILYAQGTSSSEYIYIQAPPERLQIDTTAPIQVYVKASSGQKIVHYNIMKKDKLLFEQTETVGSHDSDVLINIPITPLMVPSVTMTAYYFSSDLETIVEDRTVLFIEDVCTGETPIVSVDGDHEPTYRPGGQIDLQVFGEPYSVISMMGTGEASKLFSTDESENYDKLDNVMSSRDESMDFCDHNRKYVGTLSHSQILSCDDREAKRRKRSLFDPAMPKPLINYAFDLPGVMFDCCIVGAQDISNVYSPSKKTNCHERERFVQSGNACKKVFMKCCNLAECLRKYPGDWATCLRNLEDAEDAIPVERTVADAMQFSPQLLKTRSKTAKGVGIIRNNFDLTWFFVDFRMDKHGRKHLGKTTKPGLPRLPDRITTWNVDIISTSADHPLCVGKVLKLPVEYNVYIDVKMIEAPVVIGTHVHAEVTVYNYVKEKIEVKIHVQGDEGLCGINTENNSNPDLVQTIGSAVGDTPSVFGINFVMVPLKSGELKIKFRLRVASLKIFDQVEKILKVHPKENLKGKVNWVLMDSKHKGYTLRRGSKSQKKIPLRIPDLAVPGTEEVLMSVYSVSSVSMLDELETTGPATTIQHIFYKLVPAVEKLVFMMKTSNISSETDDPLFDKIQEAQSSLLGYVKPIKQLSGSNTKLFGFSHSPAANSVPSMMLTSSVVELLYRITPVVKVDQNLLQGCLNWVLSHQMRQGYFKSAITWNAGGKRDATNPSDRLYLSERDKKVYITSKMLIDLVSIKQSLERNSASESELSKVERVLQKGRMFVKRKINKVARQSKCSSMLALSTAVHALYRTGDSVSPSAFNSLMKRKRSDQESRHDLTKSKWIDVCPYNPTNKDIDEDDIQANVIEGTAHMLNIVLLKGYQGNSYAKWLLQNRDIEGSWKSYRAAVTAMKALGMFVNMQKQNMSESLRIELNDPEYSNLTFTSNSEPIVTKIKLKNTRPEISYSTYGQGKAWLKVEKFYQVASPTVKLSPVKFRTKKQSKPPPSCIYDMDISVEEPLTPFLVDTPTSRAAGNRNKWAWDVTIRVDIKDVYNIEEYQSYVIEFNLPVDSKVLKNSHDMLFNSVEHLVDHYRETSKSVLLYMTGGQEIRFKILQSHRFDAPIPVKIYPVTAPEKSCTKFYNYPGQSSEIATFCSNTDGSSSEEICKCVDGKNCPEFYNKAKKTLNQTIETRLTRSCGEKSTFAYKVKLTKKQYIDINWHVYDGVIEKAFRSVGGTETTALESKTHVFWIKTKCKEIPLRKHYLVIGHAVSVDSNGKYKHLLDKDSWVERWLRDPGNCEIDGTGQQCVAYKLLEEYAFEIDKIRRGNTNKYKQLNKNCVSS